MFNKDCSLDKMRETDSTDSVTESETKMLLRHISLKPSQYNPLSKLKLACTIGDAEAVKRFEPGLVCQAVVKTSCGSTYRLRTTKKCHRLSLFPGLREPLLLRIGSDWHVPPWDGRVPKKRRRS